MPETTRVLVVTGAGSGIGRAIATQAVRDGFAVVAVSQLAEQLHTLAAQVAQNGGAFVTLAIDVTARDTPQRIAQTARECFGRMDVLINNAGAAKAGSLLDQSDEEIDAQWQLHVAGPLRIARAALPLLRESGGQMMFVGSGLARVPPPYYGAYCAAKAAVRAMTTQLRRELHGSGIAVTYIDPGSVRTDFGKNAGIPTYDPEWIAVEADHVAHRILRAVRTRPHAVNAVPLHTLGIALGEMFPRIVDRVMAKRTASAPSEVATPQPMPQPAPSPVAQAVPQPVPQPEPGVPSGTDFERALEPVSRRMERVKLSPSFLADLLRTGGDVQLAEAAMRWAGMPNKNERAAMTEVLDALAAGGFLEKTGEERWRVLRAPD